MLLVLQPIRDWQWVGFPTNYSVSRTHKIGINLGEDGEKSASQQIHQCQASRIEFNRFETGEKSASQQITQCQEHKLIQSNRKFISAVTQLFRERETSLDFIRYQPIRDWRKVGFPTNHSVSRTRKIDIENSLPTDSRLAISRLPNKSLGVKNTQNWYRKCSEKVVWHTKTKVGTTKKSFQSPKLTDLLFVFRS